MSSSDYIENQANIYLFDLQNLAGEHGCKADDNWEVEQATLEEKIQLEKQYHLILINKILPEYFPELFRRVRSKLNLKPIDLVTNGITGQPKSGPYLIAFHKGKIKS